MSIIDLLDLIKKNGCIKYSLNFGIVGVNEGLFTNNRFAYPSLYAFASKIASSYFPSS